MTRQSRISEPQSFPELSRDKLSSTSSKITRSPDHPITRSISSHLHGEIIEYYRALLSRYGPQNWWPGQSRFEVIVGAYLTQNTNWSNVEKALANLRRARLLSLTAMRKVPLVDLETLVRPSGYFRQKARNLKTFISFLDEHYSGSLSRMFAGPTEKLRNQLLALNGVGPETADSILLYAGNHPVFVVDAYTRRLLERHGAITSKTKYEEIRSLMEQALSNANPDSLVTECATSNPRHSVSLMSSSLRSEIAQHYNEFHALIVRVGNQHCRTKAICEGCPLEHLLKPDLSTTACPIRESYRTVR